MTTSRLPPGWPFPVDCASGDGYGVLRCVHGAIRTRQRRWLAPPADERPMYQRALYGSLVITTFLCFVVLDAYSAVSGPPGGCS